MSATDQQNYGAEMNEQEPVIEMDGENTNIPDDAAALLFTSDGGFEILLPSEDELTVPDHVLRAVIVATVTFDKNQDLLDQLTDRFYAAADSFIPKEEKELAGARR